MTLQFWITTAAIVLGPLLAVLTTRYLENRRRDYERRHAVFRSLMKTRKSWGSPEHVEALNLIEIEFHGKGRVLKAYKKLFEYFQNDLPRRDQEEDNDYFLRKSEHHSSLLSALLLEMSKDLGYRHDQFEILKGGYSPVLFGEIEEDQLKIRKLLAGLHDGKMVVPTAIVDWRHPEQLLEEAKNAQLLLEHAEKAEAEKK